MVNWFGSKDGRHAMIGKLTAQTREPRERKGEMGSNRGYSETQIRIGGPIEAMRLDSSDEQ